MGKLFDHSYVLNQKSLKTLTGLIMDLRHFQKPTFAALLDQILLAKSVLVRKATKLVIEDIFGISLKNGVDGSHHAQSILKKGLT